MSRTRLSQIFVSCPQYGKEHLCTLSGGLSVGAGEGNHTLVHLDAHHHALLFDQLGEGLAVVRLLVECLVEEDDATDAGVDPFVGSEEKLAVKPPVLLRVLCVDALEALGHAAWRCQQKGRQQMELETRQMFNGDPETYRSGGV